MAKTKKTTRRATKPSPKKEKVVKEKSATKKASTKQTESNSTFNKDIFKYVLVAVAVVFLIGISYYAYNQTFGAEQKEVDVVVALVNDIPIYKSEIDQQYNVLPSSYRQQISKETILNRTIDETALLQKAIEDGYKATNEEVENLINGLMNENQISQEMLEAQLQSTGMTFDDLKEIYAKQIAITKLLNESVISKLEVTEAEAQEYYNNNLESPLITTTKQVKARHILTNTEEEAQNILNKINEGESFAELAKTFSNDPGSAIQGGDLGYFPEGVMVTEFNNAAFEMTIDEAPRIVETQFGFHVIDVTGIKDERVKSFEEAKDSIETTIIEGKEQTEIIKFIEQVRNDATITTYLEKLTNSLPKGISTFQQISDEVCTKNGKPVVSVFTTSSCPHCKWIEETIVDVLRENQHLVDGHVWNLDTKDDLVTPLFDELEEIPTTETLKFYNNNPQGSVPMFYFGCKYIRFGNGYEAADDLKSERAEFQALIDALVKSRNQFKEEAPALQIAEAPIEQE